MYNTYIIYIYIGLSTRECFILRAYIAAVIRHFRPTRYAHGSYSYRAMYLYNIIISTAYRIQSHIILNLHSKYSSNVPLFYLFRDSRIDCIVWLSSNVNNRYTYSLRPTQLLLQVMSYNIRKRKTRHNSIYNQ